MIHKTEREIFINNIKQADIVEDMKSDIVRKPKILKQDIKYAPKKIYVKNHIDDLEYTKFFDKLSQLNIDARSQFLYELYKNNLLLQKEREKLISIVNNLSFTLRDKVSIRPVTHSYVKIVNKIKNPVNALAEVKSTNNINTSINNSTNENNNATDTNNINNNSKLEDINTYNQLDFNMPDYTENYKDESNLVLDNIFKDSLSK